MMRSFLYFIIGTAVSFFLNRWLLGTLGWQADLYHAAAFGLGWALAYFVDRPEWPLPKKMGISFIGVAVLIVVGLLFFNMEIAVPSIIKFSTIFVAYYLMASFRSSKSLRN